MEIIKYWLQGLSVINNNFSLLTPIPSLKNFTSISSEICKRVKRYKIIWKKETGSV